jgi:hypothetical protein
MVIKNFYSIQDFYNFIRKPNNAPNATGNLATLVPYPSLFDAAQGNNRTIK